MLRWAKKRVCHCICIGLSLSIDLWIRLFRQVLHPLESARLSASIEPPSLEDLTTIQNIDYPG